jgi:hypothetical protein
MRRIGFSLCFAAAAVMLLGATPTKHPRPVIPPKPAAAKGLRGSEPAKPVNAAALGSSASPPAPNASAVPTDPGQCRVTCAHTYYFCLSGDDAPSCPQNWSSCLDACNRPPIQPETAVR